MMGYPEAKVDHIKFDRSIDSDVIASLKVKPKFLSMLPGYDPSSKTFRPPAEDNIIDECAVVEINCDGTAIPPVQTAVLKEVKRNNFPPPIQIDCMHNLQAREPPLVDYVRGDPGSIFTFTCPANCYDQGELIGAGLYNYTSQICKAAIQQSMLDNSQSG